MAIELFWDDSEETVLLMEVRGQWTWAELTATMNTIKRLSTERQRALGAILDLSSGLQLPDGGLFNRDGLAQFQKLIQLDNGKKGPMVILGLNGLVKQIFETVSAMNQSATKNIYFAQTMPEAQKKIYGLVQASSAAR